MSTGIPPKESLETQDSLSSERLKRAIERNRIKRLKRNVPSKDSRSYPHSPRSVGTHTRAQSGFQRTLARHHRMPENLAPSLARVSRADDSTRMAARRAIPLDREAREGRPLSQQQRGNSDKKKRRLVNFILMLVWPLHGFLLLRLAFSQGGVVDYYDKQDFLRGRYYHLESVEHENKLLEKEIDLIKHNGNFQKELIRKHLGFIAEDEYLVLFAKGKGLSSR